MTLTQTEHEAIGALLKKHPSVAVHNCAGSYLALIVAQLTQNGRYPRPVVVVTSDEDRARETARDLGFFLDGVDQSPTVMELPEVMQLVQVESSPYAEISPDRVAVMQRLGTLFRISQGYGGSVLVASVQALHRRVLPSPAMVDRCDLVVAEDEADRDDLVQRLLLCGFNHVQVVEDPGTFSVRGGIVDLFPPLYRFPVRVEFFGDLVESIRLFDPSSQRTLRPIDEVLFYPVRETIPTLTGAELRARVLKAADEAQHPSSRTRILLEELESGREFFGIEALTPAFHETLAPLSDYLPRDSLWLLLDPDAINGRWNEERERAEEAYAARLAEGRLTFPPADFYVDQDALWGQSPGPRRVLIEPLVIGGESSEVPSVRCHVKENADVAAELARARSERGEEILKALVVRLRRWQEEGRPVLIAVSGPSQLRRLHALLKEYGLAPVMLEESERETVLGFDGESAGHVTLCPGELGSGFRLPGGLVVLTDAEIFGPRARTRRSAHVLDRGPGIGDLGEIAQGDPVVHSEHGVGIYQGLKKLEIKGVPADFLLLEYLGGDRLYLPVYHMNLVHRYVGGDRAAPKLDRLGGVTWSRKKGKVRSDVRKMAEELLQLYAQRAALAGHTYPSPDAVYSEFEATFPFTETTDQHRTVEEVLADLTSSRPMDRLVCGDVGFGKTEVALRAAFHVAMSGRQVAVLAPTTVLVEQHLRTFSDRFRPYPLLVESLSRLRRKQEQTQVVADLAAGKVDLVIGTHRLLQSDIHFRDLGLLVIDEEHRFGVSHKERLKRLRTQVDVLTMTATPIPRTLHMGMVGLRSISIISTPPVDRLAIRTFVCRFDDKVVEAGIRKELDRGGQVFFVHNRVRTIEQWAERVGGLVPTARVAVAHGQMDARRLERVMVDFVAGRFDVLVCSAIIESGLDIPRANTMFINDAHTFGLAQLYQLRGRIGRARHRAFCYLLVPGFEAMSTEGRQRLSVLERFSELGSGFSIASHDLEIRGAGELLGAKQSGQIAAVGFETYARILEEAVSELKGEPITAETDPEIKTQIPAYIPDDYVEDTGQRLVLYKRLSSAARDEDAVQDLLAEMQDRYGPRPEEVDALGELMVVKGLASELGAKVLDLTPTRLSLTLCETTPLSPERVIQLVQQGSRFRLTPEMRLICNLSERERASGQVLASVKKVLHQLIQRGN